MRFIVAPSQVDKRHFQVQGTLLLTYSKVQSGIGRASPIQTRAYDAFECTGIRASTPNSDFLRGHLERFAQTLTGETVKCEKTKCVSTGDQFCQFECREEATSPQTPRPWKSEVWGSLTSKSLNKTFR